MTTETVPDKKHSFYEVLPDGRYKIRVDHHLINTFNTCDQLFEYKHIDHWRKKGEASWSMLVGSWWSRAMEMFYREMTFGRLPTLEETAKMGLDAWHELDMDVAFAQTDPKKYEKFGGQHGAVHMIADYYSKFATHDYTNWQIIGAESGFGLKDEVLLGEDDKVIVYYVGKPDLMLFDKQKRQVIPLDHKTKDYVPSNIHSQFKPHPQTTGYIFVANLLASQLGMSDVQTNSCIINVAARFPPSDKPRDGVPKPRFCRVFPSYNPDELEEWRRGVIEKSRRLRDSIERNVWSRRESACHLYAGCAFRGVCSVPAASRKTILGADFNQIDPWQAYIPEDDGGETD